MGVATRAMSSPLGTVQRASSRPMGSGSAATSSTPLAIASMRLSSSVSRSRSAGVKPLPAAMSFALAARMSALRARIAAAAASKALFFVSVEASRIARAAPFAAAPSAIISSRRLTIRSPSARGRRDGSSRRGRDSRGSPRSPPCACRRCARRRPRRKLQGRARFSRPAWSFTSTASPRWKRPSIWRMPAGSRLLPSASARAAPASMISMPSGFKTPAIQRLRAAAGVPFAAKCVWRSPLRIAATDDWSCPWR